MKINSCICGLSLSGLLALTVGCSRVEPQAFDRQYGEVSQDVVDKASEVLTSAKYGWETRYVSGGGAPFLLQFRFDKDHHVTIYSDFDPEPSVSSYRFRLSRGAVLSFDTYGLLHKISDPSILPDMWDDSMRGKGYQGDTEFEILSVSPEKIILRGMKNINDSTILVPLDHEPNIHKSVPALHRLVRVFHSSMHYFHSIDLAGSPQADFFVHDEPNDLISSACLPVIDVLMKDGEGKINTRQHTLHPTDGGFKADPALTIGGETYQDFLINEDKIVAKDNPSLVFNLDSDKPMSLPNPGAFIPRQFYWTSLSNGQFSELFTRNVLAPYRANINPDAKELDLGWFNNTDEWRPFSLWAPKGPQPRVELGYSFVEEDQAWLFKVFVPDDIKALVTSPDSGYSAFLKYFTNYYDADTRVYIQDVSREGDNSVLRFISGKDSRYWFTVHLG